MVDAAESCDKSELVFVEQFVMGVPGFSSQYGSDTSISYTAYNVTGKPSKFPEYGDFPQAFVMRTYGNWWKECPSKLHPIMSQSLTKYDSQDFIDLEFEQSVYPVRVNIYETYNPGSVIRIWAADCNANWKLLWEGEPQDIGHMPRIFSPELRVINFETRLLRLEFYHLHLDYYTELDAVLMLGTKQPMSNLQYPHDLEDPSVGKLTSQILQLNIHNIPPQVDISNSISDFLGKDFPRYLSEANSMSSGLPLQTTNETGKKIDRLSDELILYIFGFLDLVSLCRCAQVSRHFYDLANDGLLYTELNLKVYWNYVTPCALNSLSHRCQYLQKLDLSWCGSMQVLRPADFISFITRCGKQLTHLRLNSCKFIDDRCIYKISKYCGCLRELGLENCVTVNGEAFRTLSCLHNLEYLNFYRTTIDNGPLQEILMASPHLKHINLGSCLRITNMDDVAITLGAFNSELVSADFWKTYSLTPAGVRALARCSKLEEVDLGWCLGFGPPGDSLHALARGCPRLKKLFFAALRGVTDRDLEPFIELCPLLEQVDLLGVRSISPDLCEKILKNCQNLKLLDISFCDQILKSQVVVWKHQYPSVCIKRSFQNPGDDLAYQM
nr:Fbxl4 protein [Gryllus bimaculatus]